MNLAVCLITSFNNRLLTSILNGGGGNRTRVRRYSTKGFYMFILFFNLASRLLKRKGTLKPALIKLRAPGSKQTRVATLLVDAPQAPQENT